VVLSTRNASLSPLCALRISCVCVWRINFVHTVFVCECSSACVCFERVESPLLCSALRVLSLIRNKQLKPVSHSHSRHLARREIALASRAFQLSRCSPPWKLSAPTHTNISSHSIPEFSLRNSQPRHMSETLTNSNTQNTYLSLSSKAIVSSHNL
jgi:hypothetical protein